MLQEAGGPGRRFRTAALDWPYGRGINLQIEVSDLLGLYEEVIAASVTPVVAIEKRSYRVGDREIANEQFVVADRDGYLLRFFSDSPTEAPADS